MMTKVVPRVGRESKAAGRTATLGDDSRSPSGPDDLRSDVHEDPATADERRQCMIAEAAYFVAIRRGLACGYELDDWLTAERVIDAALAQEPSTARGRNG